MIFLSASCWAAESLAVHGNSRELAPLSPCRYLIRIILQLLSVTKYTLCVWVVCVCGVWGESYGNC